MKILEILQLHKGNYKTDKNQRIVFENLENHENTKIQRENHDNHDNLKFA